LAGGIDRKGGGGTFGVGTQSGRYPGEGLRKGNGQVGEMGERRLFRRNHKKNQWSKIIHNIEGLTKRGGSRGPESFRRRV